MLEDLVARLPCTPTVDIRSTRLLLERRSVLADVCPPYVVERAGTQAVHTLAVVGPNDHVGEGSSVLEDEDGVSIATFGLVVAG